MNISLFIAQRLQLKGTNRDTSSSSTIIAVVGITIAIIVMLLTITIVLGFKHQIQVKVMGFDSQITINPAINYYTGESEDYITLNDSLQNVIEQTINDSNANIALSVNQPGIIKTDNNYIGLIFKGISKHSDTFFINQNLIDGNLYNFYTDSCKNKIIISSFTSSALNINIGDKVNTYFFTKNNLRTRKFEIAGIYNSNFGEYDKLIAYAPLSTLQRIAQLDSTSGTIIEISRIDNDLIQEKSIALQSAINNAVYQNYLHKIYNVNNVKQSGAMYFNWLDLLDTNVVVILILMGCVAGITLISCLFIIILERIKTIGLLKAIGATNAQIRQIFIYMALRLVLRGMIIGNIISLSFVYIQDVFRIIPLDPEAYYLSYVPVEINWDHILFLNFCVIIIAGLILIAPSHLASKISPSQTMRYE